MLFHTDKAPESIDRIRGLYSSAILRFLFKFSVCSRFSGSSLPIRFVRHALQLLPDPPGTQFCPAFPSRQTCRSSERPLAVHRSGKCQDRVRRLSSPYWRLQSNISAKRQGCFHAPQSVRSAPFTDRGRLVPCKTERFDPSPSA